MAKQLWKDPYKPDENPHVSILTGGRINRNLRVGFSSYWFNLNPNLNDYICKNSKEAIYLRYFLKLGYVYFLGLSPHAFQIEHPRAIDCSYEFRDKLPHWDKERFGTTPNYMRYCVENFKKELGIKLPELDFVYVNLMPTFVRRNARNYVLLHKYAIQDKTQVLSYDPSLELVYQGVKEIPDGGRTAETDCGKLMNISGYDYQDKASHLKMAPNMIHLVQTGPWGLATLQKGNPLLTFCTWWLPYHPLITRRIKIRTDPSKFRYPIGYVGNDNRRRGAIGRWFGKLPKNFVHMFGGNYRKDLGTSWPEELIKRYPNIKWHKPVHINKVADIYNKSTACLNLAVPPFEAVGVQAWRHVEAPMGGCPLLLPASVAHAEKLTMIEDSDADAWCVVKSQEELQAKVEVLISRPLLRREIVEMQREVIQKRYTMKTNLKNLFKVLTPRLE